MLYTGNSAITGGGGGGGNVTTTGLTPLRLPAATTATNLQDSRLKTNALGDKFFFDTGASFNVGIVAAGNSVALGADSTTTGFLPPRMTNAQRIAIVLPATGLEVYCTDAPAGLYYYNGATWILVGTGSGSVTSPGMAIGTIPVADAAQDIFNSNIQQGMAGPTLGNIGIGGGPVANAILQLNSTVSGMLIPRMTNAQRIAMPVALPDAGLQVYCTNAPVGLYYFDGVVWVLLGTGTGNVTTGAGFTAGKVPVATGAANIENSTLSVAGSAWDFAAPASVGMQQLRGTGAAPTIVVGINATAAAIAGSDLAGNFTVTFVAIPVINTPLVVITFNTPYAVAPSSIIVGCAGPFAVAACSVIHCDITSILTTKFTVNTGGVIGALALQTTSFFYIVVQ